MNEAAPTVPRAGTEIKFTERQIRNFWLKVDKEGPLPDQTNPHYAGLDRCWVWTDHKHKRGYGCFRVGRKMVHAHRVAWMIAHGEIPSGVDDQRLCVMHICDRTSCCRVDHLRLGSHTDNMHDMAAKGRNRQPSGDASSSRTRPERRPRGDKHFSRTHPEYLARGDRNGSRLHPESRPRGETHSNAKLTVVQVLEIRALYAAGGFTYDSLGAQFGVARITISRIINRQVWAHIPEEWV